MNFTIPKIDIPKLDKSILPSASDFGLDSSDINSKVSEVVSRVNTRGVFDLSSFENPKEKATELIKSIPSVAGFSFTSLIPTSMFDKLDTNKISKNLNSEFGTIELGELGSFKLPDDIGKTAKDIISGKGFDFMSLYSMPATPSFETNIGSEFNLNELTTEMNSISDIAGGEFNVNEYLNEYSSISI